MKNKTILVLSAALFIASATQLFARTWTDAASGRTLEGDYVESDSSQVVIKSGGRNIKIAIARLSDADKVFIKEQSAKAANNPFTTITAPVSVKSLPVKGKGEERKAGLEMKNNGDQAISRLVVRILLFGEDGSVKKTVPHTSDGYFGERGKELGKGRDFVKELDDFWIKDDIASVAGLPENVTWKDGSKWPAWTGPAPQPEGDVTVSLVMKGVVREGGLAAPLIECFNHSNNGIKEVQYRLFYLDGEGNELNRGLRTGLASPNVIMEAGNGMALIGNDEGPPKGATDIRLTLHSVTFEDDSKWASEG